MRFKSIYFPFLTCMICRKNGVNTYICADVIEDLSRFYSVSDPIAGARLLYKHLYAPGIFPQGSAPEPVAEVPISDLDIAN